MPLFVTDTCMSLMNALDTVFPSSKKILCTWHMMNNVTKQLNKGNFVNNNVKQECIDFIKRMISTKNEEIFWDLVDKYLKDI